MIATEDRNGLFNGLPARGSTAYVELLVFLNANRSAVLAALPWVAAEIAGNEGFEVMLDFVCRLGGRRLYISARLQEFSRATDSAFGLATHRNLLRGAGVSSLLEAPSAWGVFLVFRRVALARALAEGVSKKAAARLFGVTERSLRGPQRTESAHD
ncbi:MAG TPA: hypothetical protein VF633_03235 [Brevundimonas sp.]